MTLTRQNSVLFPYSLPEPKPVEPVGKFVDEVYAPKRRIRNAKVMTDGKLSQCYEDLSQGWGDAYDRCLERGSGDPDRDLAVVEDEMQRRGML
jgi:hypothetical protein